MKPTIIIPAYNESAFIVSNLRKMLDFLRENWSVFELILVDDGSTDNTLELAQSVDGVRVLTYQANRGKGYAVKYGALQATGDVVIFTDADLAYSTKYISDCIETLKEADVAIGSRYTQTNVAKNYTRLRKMASFVFVWLVNFFLDLNFSDIQCGLKGFKSEAAKALFTELHTDGFGFDVELLARAKQKSLTIEEFPVEMQATTSSKVRLIRDSLKMFYTILVTKWKVLV